MAWRSTIAKFSALASLGPDGQVEHGEQKQAELLDSDWSRTASASFSI